MFGARRVRGSKRSEYRLFEARKDQLLTNPTLIEAGRWRKPGASVEAFGGNSLGYGASALRRGDLRVWRRSWSGCGRGPGARNESLRGWVEVTDEAEEVPRVWRQGSGPFAASGALATKATWPLGAGPGGAWGHNLVLHPTPGQESATLGSTPRAQRRAGAASAEVRGGTHGQR